MTTILTGVAALCILGVALLDNLTARFILALVLLSASYFAGLLQ